MLKSHSCGQLNSSSVGTKLTLAGWVDRRRDHGGLIFIDLRDRTGIVQVVFNPETSQSSHEVASELRNEYVISLSGEVALRPRGTENPKLPTGEVEVIAQELTILNPSTTPPFYINEDAEIDESVRLRYRYLDLRRERMQKNLLLRHRALKVMRDFLDSRGFLEVETPLLIKSTPEGARDYLVPSRIHPGKFYALPQSPQQIKQLLMVAGIEKYFQVARCFRDEDTRADRQPEFTQLDIEMSFIDAGDMLNLVEEMVTCMMDTVRPDVRLVKPFPRLRYAEAMERYGSDKPDLRFGLEINDLSGIAAQTGFAVFQSAIALGGGVKGICAPGCAAYTRHQLEELNRIAQGYGVQGLLTIALSGQADSLAELTEGMVKSVAAKHVSLEQIKEMARCLKAGPGDLLLIIAGAAETTELALGGLRQEMGSRLGLAKPDTFAFAFIVDFPLFKTGEKKGRWAPQHHPFTAPDSEDIPLLDTAPGKVRSQHYDLVCNGYEIAGGSIRVHQPDLQRKIFKLLGYRDKDIEELFGHLLEAFEYGAPPHGGIALGFDRFMMVLAGEESIREVMAFPKNQNAVDMTLNAPSPVSREQLTELHLRLQDD